MVQEVPGGRYIAWSSAARFGSWSLPTTPWCSLDEAARVGQVSQDSPLRQPRSQTPFASGEQLVSTVDYRGGPFRNAHFTTSSSGNSAMRRGLAGAHAVIVPTALMMPYEFIAEQVVPRAARLGKPGSTSPTSTTTERKAI
jgi:hypothetical protein